MIVAALLLGTALVADALTLSIVCGSREQKSVQKGALLTALFFGGFQGIMPIIGWSIGRVGSRWVQSFDQYIACGILLFLGIKMMLDGRSLRDLPSLESGRHRLRQTAAMAFATSIDALTAGIAFPSVLGAQAIGDVLLCAGLIGGVTFLFCLGGFFCGHLLQKALRFSPSLIGGAILILIGLRLLITG